MSLPDIQQKIGMEKLARFTGCQRAWISIQNRTIWCSISLQ